MELTNTNPDNCEHNSSDCNPNNKNGDAARFPVMNPRKVRSGLVSRYGSPNFPGGKQRVPYSKTRIVVNITPQIATQIIRMVTPRAFLVMKPGECGAVWYLATGVRISRWQTESSLKQAI